MRRGFLFLSFLLCGSFIFSARVSCASGPTVVPQYIEKSTTWTKEKSPYIIQSNVYVQAKLVIEPGTVVKFSYATFSLYINAEFSARGTKNEKIVFTSIHDDSDGVDSDKDFTNPRPPQTPDWEKININPSAKVELNNTVVKYGRVALYSIGTSANYKNLTIRNSQISYASTGIYMENLEPVIDGNLITKNGTGIIAFINNGFDRLTTASNNSFVGNGIGVYGSNSAGGGKPSVDTRNNWWGDASGPKEWVRNPQGKGNEVNSFVLFDPWLGKDPFAGPDPVIVIPGIMGSWKKDGEWQIDPIFHTYDNLCEEFLANGYEDGKTFSVFPYEWRDSNIKNAKLLRDRINQIKADTGRPKVDIVAHSMGGLLAREYIESDYYQNDQNDVDQLITVGTPQLGAPKDYVTWEGGEFLGLWSSVMKRAVTLEALENGYFDVFDYIHKRPMTSVEELLPVYNYLYDDNGSDYIIRNSYPNNYPRNIFLENLNSAEKIKSLKNTEFTKIIGKTNSETNTVSGYNVVNSNESGLWADGYPKYFDVPVLSRQGITKSGGDGTVPVYSAEAADIFADKKIYLESEHNALPTDAQKDILEILTGKRPTSEVRKWHIPSLLLITVHSPVDIQIESPSGEKIGKNFETNGTYDEIEGAYYTGFDTNTEFLTIPNPEDGEYKIIAQGTGIGGNYGIEIAKVSENTDDPENAKESSVTIEGDAEAGQIQKAAIKIEDEEMSEVKNTDTTPPVITGYVTSSPNDNGWYGSAVVVHFEASDSESGIDTITPDIVISTEGANQSATGTATDKAGNSASYTVSGISIDKTGPKIDIFNPKETVYTNNQILAVDYKTEDSLSGVVGDNWQVEKDGQKLDWLEKEMDLSLEHLGNYIFKVNATDKAGNSSSEDIKFQIATNLDAIQKNISHYFSDLKLISSQEEFDYYQARIAHAKSLFDQLASTRKNKKPLANIQKEIRLDVDHLIGHIQKSASVSIDPKTADLLIEDLNYLKSF